MMTYTLRPLAAISGEAVLPLVLVKQSLRVEFDLDDEDLLIAALRDAALDWVEVHTGFPMQRRRFEWRGLPSGTGTIVLPLQAVEQIESVNFADGNGGAAVAVSAVDPIGTGILIPAAGASWPTGSEASGYTVTFVAGLAVTPPALVSAARLLIGDLFLQRENIVAGTIVSEVPFGVVQLCRPFRRIPV
jgi:uncharacterized phiE125 gp8 family phage protein